MSKYLIKNVNLGNLDDLSTRRVNIVIENGRFTKISEKIAREDAMGANVIDANGMLGLPGFTDAHTHMAQSFLKGPLDDLPITEWLVKLFSIEEHMSDDDYYYGTLLGCLSSLKFGTTTVNEMGDMARIDVQLKAFEDAGIRTTYGVSTTDIAENEVTPIISVEKALKIADEIYSKAHGANNGLIRAAVAPAGLPAVSKQMAQALKKYANERDLVYHTHLGEGKMETENVARMYNLRGETEALYNFGILDEKTLLAHSIWLPDFELDMIAQTKANPVHCPNTNMKISDGIPPIAKMLERGINVAMGCDGEASSSTRDMIREGRAGAYLQKVVTLDPTVMDAATTMKMMTINGAKALGYQDLGEVKVGNQADLILARMDDDLSLTDRQHPIGNLLYAGDGHAIDTVFVRGNLMVRNKKLQGFDEREFVATCNDRIEILNEKIKNM
ncbi:MAG: amidohydrolase family protein [Erysipelotrichaceae bacterium]|jgi:5-methylthioadenosine/S-adenosylhomocysteine deaminase